MNKQYANLGSFFQRGYFDGLTVDNTRDKNKQKKYFEERNNELIESSKIKISEESFISDTIPLELKTVYPGLITGIGTAHATGMEGEARLGMAFDFTSGLPYIPGSSVKGLLRSVFPILPSNRPIHKIDQKTKKILQEKRRYICGIWNEIIVNKWSEFHPELSLLQKLEENEVDKLAKLIFEGETPNSFLSIYDRDIFFDAQIKGDYKKKGFLDFDYITPHKEALSNPNPIKFLKILPNVTFVFSFRLHNHKLSSGKEIPAKAKLWLFKEILTTIGIGAKTNVGYGQLKDPNEVSMETQQDDVQNQRKKTNNKIECSGTMEIYKGVGYKVRLEDSGYKGLYNLEVLDRKKLNKKSKRVKVVVTIENDKVKKVTFKSSI